VNFHPLALCIYNSNIVSRHLASNLSAVITATVDRVRAVPYRANFFVWHFTRQFIYCTNCQQTHLPPCLSVCLSVCLSCLVTCLRVRQCAAATAYGDSVGGGQPHQMAEVAHQNQLQLSRRSGPAQCWVSHLMHTTFPHQPNHANVCSSHQISECVRCCLLTSPETTAGWLQLSYFASFMLTFTDRG